MRRWWGNLVIVYCQQERIQRRWGRWCLQWHRRLAKLHCAHHCCLREGRAKIVNALFNSQCLQKVSWKLEVGICPRKIFGPVLVLALTASWHGLLTVDNLNTYASVK